WVYLILGLWVAASPWLVESFGFPLNLSNLVVGAVVALLALWGAFGRK
ncbi:MAG: SPW repeat protein, partial [Candidatus Colwellbacteria bacterium]|nr:SPW repeat protein [Candidatus Colwellbacteria bacterium]